MTKKFLCLLLIFTLLLSALIACDSTQNDINTTTENTVYTTANDINTTTENTVASTENITENGTTNDIPEKEPSPEISTSTDDALSYDDIIAMYKQIVNLYPYYTEEKMLSNECDGMDAIDDEETKELYTKLFISGYRFYLEEYAYKYNGDGRNYFGYTITDLNKNGSEELILLTDMYDIIAVFSMQENQAKLLFENYERNYYCRIDEQGRFYTQHSESSNLYTHIYSLDEHDNLVLDEKYLCVYYNTLDHDECYDIMNEEKIRISKSQWTTLTHGWVYGYNAGIITKTYAKLSFTRLFGELYLYLPDIYTWEWSSSQFYDYENTLHIFNLSDRTVSISLYDTFYTPYRHKLSVEATLNGNIATFDTEEISGRLEFGLHSIWLIIDESNISGVPCGTFIYTKLNYLVG